MERKPAAASEGLTAFADSERSLRERCVGARLEPAEWQRKLSRCSLANCRGTCCYDGIAVDDAMAAVIERLAAARAGDFAAMGLELPDQVIVDSEWQGVRSRKTAVRPFPFRAAVPDFPRHFDETACVFLLDDSRCALQVLATNDGRHPWHYKPFACWLHPIKLTAAGIRLYDETTDPERLPGYDGFVCRTHCGRTAADGTPAAELLREELAFLGRLIARDLLAETQSQPEADGTAAKSEQCRSRETREPDSGTDVRSQGNPIGMASARTAKDSLGNR
jgi:hypothetical protein